MTSARHDARATGAGGARGTTVAPGTAQSNWNIANALTGLRILLVPLFGWLLLAEGGDSTALRLWAAAVFAVATATDRLDGDLARSRGLVTDVGKIADPIADKALMGMAFVGLSIIDIVPWWVSVVVLVRELGITVMRFVVIRHGVMAASRGGKIKTVLQALALFLLILPFEGGWQVPGLIIMYLAVLVTVVTGLDYVRDAVRLARAGDSQAASSGSSAG